MRACDEDVAQVADGVALDIVHVAEAPEGLGVEGLLRKASKSMSSTSKRAESRW